jgi:hypothetical protein
MPRNTMKSMDINHSLHFDTHLQDMASLPVADDSRIHKPIRVVALPHIVQLFEELQSIQSESGPWEDFYISIINASDFPYAGGRESSSYFYSDDRNGKSTVECMDLSSILKFRTRDYLRIFWIIPVTDTTGKKNWFHLYSNSVWRDARICREFLQRLIHISASMMRARNAMSEVEMY